MRTEHEHTINGVAGRMFARYTRNLAQGTFSTQTWKASREYQREGSKFRIVVKLRFDDDCGNGHNTFAATADISIRERGAWRFYSGGCCHKEIAAQFPELAHVLKWHLVSTDGPMHYTSNTTYLAGDRDHYGLLKGEVRQILNGKTGLPRWIRDGAPTIYHDAPECPTETLTVGWRPLNRIGEGKTRELDAARSVAVWPEATDEELMAPDLRDRLQERLPSLLVAFRNMILACGFEWAATEP